MPSFEVTHDRYGAQRPDGRPAPGQLGRCARTIRVIESVHGRELTVVGLDAVTGTPVLDLRPTTAEFLPTNVRQPDWVSDLMSEYFRP